MIAQPDINDEVTASQVSPRPSDAADQGLNTLVGGILADVQDLLKQHVTLLRQELLEDFRRTKEGIWSFSMAYLLAGVAVLFLLPGLVGLLSWAVPDIPWWGWCGILAGIIATASAVLYAAGKSKFASFNPLPNRSAVAVKENIEWISNQVSSSSKQ